MTAEAFAERALEPDYENMLVELVEGKLVEMSKPGGLHGLIAGNIFAHIWNHVRQNKLGYVTAAETGYIVARRPDGRDSVRGLDVGFIRNERLPDGMPAGHIPLGPDLAVEVISDGNTALGIHSKVLELQAAGTALIWLVYPDTQTVTVHTRDGAKIYEIDDTLDGGDVLPGFTLALRDMFTG